MGKDPNRRPVGGVEVPEALYKADQVILEAYQGFSREIIRLASLGIAVIGFFVKDIAKTPGYPWLLGLATFAFLFAIGWALRHRYVSTDGFGSQIEALRARRLQPADEVRAAACEDDRNRAYKRSGRLLRWASGALWTGAVFVAGWTAMALLK